MYNRSSWPQPSCTNQSWPWLCPPIWFTLIGQWRYLFSSCEKPDPPSNLIFIWMLPFFPNSLKGAHVKRTRYCMYYTTNIMLITKRNTGHLVHMILSFSLCCTHEYRSGCAELCEGLSLTKATGAFSIRAIWANDMLWNSCCYRFVLMVWAVTLMLSLKRGRRSLRKDDLDLMHIVLSSVFCSVLRECGEPATQLTYLTFC